MEEVGAVHKHCIATRNILQEGNTIDLKRRFAPLNESLPHSEQSTCRTVKASSKMDYTIIQV